MEVEQRNKDFYTEKGLNALLTRIKTYIDLFNKNEFPFNGMMLGFGSIEIESRKECLARILELSNLTGFVAKLNMNQATGEAKIEY